jgi:hypothetical protein
MVLAVAVVMALSTLAVAVMALSRPPAAEHSAAIGTPARAAAAAPAEQAAPSRRAAPAAGREEATPANGG